MSEATQKDAELLIQLARWGSSPEYSEAFNWLWSDEFEPDYDNFLKRYPRGSEGYRKVTMACEWCEFVGVLYKHNLINQELMRDCWSFGMTWERCKGFCLGERKFAGNPKFFENFELLAKDLP